MSTEACSGHTTGLGALKSYMALWYKCVRASVYFLRNEPHGGPWAQYHGFTYLHRLVSVAETCWSLENRVHMVRVTRDITRTSTEVRRYLNPTARLLMNFKLNSIEKILHISLVSPADYLPCLFETWLA